MKVTSEEFINICSKSGLLTKKEAKKYIKEYPKDEYDEWDDLMEARKLYGRASTCPSHYYEDIYPENVDHDDYEYKQYIAEFPIYNAAKGNSRPWRYSIPS